MRKLLLLALVPVLLYSCDKEDDVNTGLSTPTCSDTTDDGKFEKFNAPETARFLENYSSIPDKETGNAIDSLTLTTHKLVIRSNELEPSLIYKTRKPVLFWAYFSYGDNQFYSWTRETLVPDSVHIAISNVRNIPELTPGCYRLYYIFSDTGYGEVYTKGHYDLDVRSIF